MDINKADKNMIPVAFENDKFNFFNPIEVDVFRFECLPFIKENDNKLYRIDFNKDLPYTDAVKWLAKMSAGGQIHFKTDSNKIAIKVKNNCDLLMCHMAATGQQGVDIYVKDSKNKEYRFYKCATFGIPTKEFECEIFSTDYKEERDFIINLPLYNGIESILIGFEKDSTLKKASSRSHDKKIVYYGTSITQGGCASRPGMLFTNILSRKLDTEIVNLGFSGSGMGETWVADIINSIGNKSMVVLDYEGNGGCDSSLEDHMEYLITNIRKANPNMPLLIVSKQPFGSDGFIKADDLRRKRLAKFQKDLVNRIKKETNDENLYFIDGYKIYGSNADRYEMTVDGIHATDLGFYMTAKYFYPIFKKILKY